MIPLFTLIQTYSPPNYNHLPSIIESCDSSWAFGHPKPFKSSKDGLAFSRSGVWERTRPLEWNTSRYILFGICLAGLYFKRDLPLTESADYGHLTLIGLVLSCSVAWCSGILEDRIFIFLEGSIEWDHTLRFGLAKSCSCWCRALLKMFEFRFVFARWVRYKVADVECVML